MSRSRTGCRPPRWPFSQRAASPRSCAPPTGPPDLGGNLGCIDSTRGRAPLGPRPPRRAPPRPRPRARRHLRRGTTGGRLRATRCWSDHGLVGFPKTSGSRGIHVNVRIVARWDFLERAPRRPGAGPRGRAPPARHRHVEVVEGGAGRPGAARLQPERPRPHGGLGLLGAGQPAGHGVVPVPMGRARRRRAGRLHHGHGARPPGRGRRPRGRHDDSAYSLEGLLDLAAPTRPGAGDAPWPPNFAKQAGEPEPGPAQSEPDPEPAGRGSSASARSGSAGVGQSSRSVGPVAAPAQVVRRSGGGRRAKVTSMRAPPLALERQAHRAAGVLGRAPDDVEAQTGRAGAARAPRRSRRRRGSPGPSSSSTSSQRRDRRRARLRGRRPERHPEAGALGGVGQHVAEQGVEGGLDVVAGGGHRARSRRRCRW